MSDGRSGGAKYPYGLSSHAPGLVIDHYATRQQARDAYHDTPQAKAIVDRFVDTQVDIGLKFESDPKARILGIDDAEAEETAAYIEDALDSWARSKTSHRSETMNFYQGQRLYAIGQHRDGENFPRLFYSSDPSLVSPLQFDFYDPNQIRGSGYTTTFGPLAGDDGIIRDNKGRETGYKVWYRDDKNGYKLGTIPHIGARSGLPHMLHGFYAEYPGQRRGYSRLAHALQEFEKLTDFSVATVNRAIKDAMLTMAVENDQLDPSDPFEELARAPGGAGPASQLFGSAKNTEDLSETADNGITSFPNYTPIPEATFSGSSIGVFNLKRGDKIKALGNQAAAESYDKFVDAFTSHIASSLSMPIEVVLQRFSNNYAASRATLILFWRVAQIWVNEMAADFLDPVVEAFVTLEIAAGRLSLPGWSDPRLRAAWINGRWIGAPMPNIDPAKTAKADREYLEIGATTLDRVARNLNGSSAASNRGKLKREYTDLPRPPWQDWSTEPTATPDDDEPNGIDNE